MTGKAKVEQFTVYLGNPTEMKYDWNALVSEVFDLMLPVVKESKKFKKLRVRSTMTAPVVADHELLCYVVPGQSDSIIDLSVFGATKDSLGDGGTTLGKSPSLIVSEVYKNAWAPDELATLVYHELMHNKFREGRKLHRRKGMASEVLSDETKQLKKNTRKLAEILHRKQPQWVAGFERKKKKAVILPNLDSQDPLEGL